MSSGVTAVAAAPPLPPSPNVSGCEPHDPVWLQSVAVTYPLQSVVDDRVRWRYLRLCALGLVLEEEEEEEEREEDEAATAAAPSSVFALVSLGVKARSVGT